MNNRIVKHYQRKGIRLNPILVKNINNVIDDIAIREMKFNGILTLDLPKFHGIEVIMLRNKQKNYKHSICLVMNGDILLPKTVYIKPKTLNEFKENIKQLRYVNK